MANPTGAGGFQKGQSGNPGGQLKAKQEVIALARQHGPACIEALASIALDPAAPPPARVSAITVLLDRGFGKPKQEVQASGNISIAVVTGIDRAPDEPDADHGR
jgi:hypothetical protein